MPGACGVACEICMFPGMGLCTLGDGCGPGTDPRAPEWIEKIRAGRSNPCYILECAVKNKIAYCLNCGQFPCDVHYQQEIYSHKVLDLTKRKLGLIE